MAITDIVQVDISANARTPSRQGFGNLLCLGYTDAFSGDLYRIYEDTADMLSDGFVATEPLYKMAQAAFAQDPRPPRVLIGRLASPSARSLTLTMLTATQGEVLSVEVVKPDGTTQTVSYTVLSSETTTTVATAFELLIEAVTGVNSTSSGAVVTATPSTAADFFEFRNPHNIAIKDNSADSSYVTTLGNILLQTKDFYFVCTDVNSETVADLVAAWAQSNKKLYITQTVDTTEATGTGVFGSGQKAASYSYSAGLYCYDPAEYACCAMAALGAVRDPGSFTWSLKALAGITPVALTATHESNLRTAGWNFYVEVANDISGIQGVDGGGAAFGGRFLDLTHGTDWLVARIQERLFGVMANADKIDYTDAGALLLLGPLKAQLRQAEDNRLLAPGWTARATLVADADPTDKAARFYDGLRFDAVYAGAIHKVRVIGNVTV